MSHTFATRPGERQYDGSDGRGDQSGSPVILHVPYVERSRVSPTSTTAHGFPRRNSPPLEQTATVRYSPYPSPLSSTTPRYTQSVVHGVGSADTSPTMSRPPSGRTAAQPISETITLPPIRPPTGRKTSDDNSIHLPPISSMDNLREAQCGEPMAVLRRLQSNDEPLEPSAPRSRGVAAEMLTQRRHSVADPVYRLSDASSNSISVGVGARTDAGPRTPLSAVAVLPSLSYPPLPRHPPTQQQLRSAVDHPEAALASGGRGALRDDRLAQSMPPSPYLDASRVDDRLRHEQKFLSQPQERGLPRRERPLSPPPSATSASSSPSDSIRTSWRPW
ncbi:hypothetical protein BD414DRAFT_404544 [Trametes punicea]|nr:hypothetical protein BD414DRAFT_404544 [Trametes punicea]